MAAGTSHHHALAPMPPDQRGQAFCVQVGGARQSEKQWLQDWTNRPAPGEGHLRPQVWEAGSD